MIMPEEGIKGYENGDVQPFDEPFDVEITDVLDLHAFRPRETRAAAAAFLEEARKRGFRVVRIIHGKGIGIQREIVRKVLAECDFVLSFKDAPEFSGSWGATVANLLIVD
jgi:DNA-nicking Smr family endonuclease